MTGQMEKPQRVTKPIQLLAAWLTGLTVIEGSSLGSAYSMDAGTWERGALVLASICYVLGFLFAIFLLQTRFRPELQEDVFYSKYLSRKDNSPLKIDRLATIEQRIDELRRDFQAAEAHNTSSDKGKRNDSEWSKWKIGMNDYLPFFDALKNRLLEAGITVDVIFGERNGASKLTEYIVSLSEEISFDYALPLLKVLAEFPFKQFHFWQPIREAGEDEDVYIGAYGTEPSYVPFSENFKKDLAQLESPSELRGLIRKHEVQS